LGSQRLRKPVGRRGIEFAVHHGEILLWQSVPIHGERRRQSRVGHCLDQNAILRPRRGSRDCALNLKANRSCAAGATKEMFTCDDATVAARRA
jgi:hypothetical protein